MKKTAILVTLALAALPVFAGLDTTGLNYIELSAGTYTNGTSYSDGAVTNVVDISGYKGNAKVVVFDSGNTSVNAQTNSAVFLQHATAKTGTWATVSAVSITAPASTGSVNEASVDLQTLHRYLRLGVTLQGTNQITHYIGATIVAP